MLFTKIVALIIGLVVIVKTFTDYRNKEENLQMVLFWVIVWGLTIYVAFFPTVIGEVIARLGNKNYTIGQIVGTGFVFILFITYRIYVKANRLEKQLNHLIRKIALNGLKNNKKKK